MKKVCLSLADCHVDTLNEISSGFYAIGRNKSDCVDSLLCLVNRIYNIRSKYDVMEGEGLYPLYSHIYEWSDEDKKEVFDILVRFLRV